MSSAPSTDAPVVPVQLTTITPVRIFNVHGEFFDTEMDVDAPLRPLQLAIEDFFLVKADVQLLLHNRQQIDPQLTLRQNGCLMLKGDPYVKLVFAVKRGPVLNVICHVRGGNRVRGGFSFPLACGEMSTAWETKQAVANELFRRQRRLDAESESAGAADEVPLNPHRLRLMWRYMELNDKATLHYYRVPTNAEMHVRLRKGPVPAYTPPTRGGAAEQLAQIPPQHFSDAVRVGVGSSGQAAIPADIVTPLAAWQQQQDERRREAEAAEQQQRHQQQQQQQALQDYYARQRQEQLWMPPQSVAPASSNALPTRPIVCDVRHYADVNRGVAPMPAQVYAAPPPPQTSPHQYSLPQLTDSTSTSIAEVATLRRQTQWVSTQLELVKQQYSTQQSQLQENRALRQELEFHSARRIEELEVTMRHFQQYLERALRLMAEPPTS